jgi:hypothetical protein
MHLGFLFHYLFRSWTFPTGTTDVADNFEYQTLWMSNSSRRIKYNVAICDGFAGS